MNAEEGEPMKTVILTDGKYRSAIAAARALGRAGYRVIVTEAKDDVVTEPPVFSSVFATGVWIPGSVKDSDYPKRLIELLSSFERPVLFPIGAATLTYVAENLELFSGHADLIVSEPEILNALNDKEKVHDKACSLGIPVPREYNEKPDRFPVIIKPRCGEKLGLKAADRYTVAANKAEFELKYEKIGQIFGGRKHTTVMHGCDNVDQNQELKNQAEEIYKLIT